MGIYEEGRAGYEYGGVCETWVCKVEKAPPYPIIPGQALLPFYPSLLLKFKFYPIPNQSIHPNATHCFTLPLLKPFLTLLITPHNLSCPALPNSLYQYRCEMGYSTVEWDGVGLHNDYELVTGMLHVLYVIS